MLLTILILILFTACEKENSLPVNNSDCGCKTLTDPVDIRHCMDTCSYWQPKAKHVSVDNRDVVF